MHQAVRHAEYSRWQRIKTAATAINHFENPWTAVAVEKLRHGIGTEDEQFKVRVQLANKKSYGQALTPTTASKQERIPSMREPQCNVEARRNFALGLEAVYRVAEKMGNRARLNALGNGLAPILVTSALGLGLIFTFQIPDGSSQIMAVNIALLFSAVLGNILFSRVKRETLKTERTQVRAVVEKTKREELDSEGEGIREKLEELVHKHALM